MLSMLQARMSVQSRRLWQNTNVSVLFISQISVTNICVIARPDSISVSPTPRDFALAKDGDDSSGPSEQVGAEQVLAADYDPSLDRREDERRRFGDQPLPIELEEEEEVEEEVEEEEEDDIDDMFAVASLDKPKVRKVRKVKVGTRLNNVFRISNSNGLEASRSCSNNDCHTRYRCGSRRILQRYLR